MQREALIGLTVLLTLAVLGGGQKPDVAYAASQVEPAMQEASVAIVPAHSGENTLCLVDKTLQTRVGPVQIQLVGTGETAGGSLKVQLDLAM